MIYRNLDQNSYFSIIHFKAVRVDIDNENTGPILLINEPEV